LNYNNNPLLVNEPLGWKDDGKSFTRNSDYHGIFVELSNNVTFIDLGATYIKDVYDVYGINAEIKLKKEIRHPQTDKWVLDYEGVLDLSEYSYENGKVTVKFNSSGLLSLVKARQNEKVEIERTTTMDGVTLPELQTKSLYLDGRRIFLVSQDSKPEQEQFRAGYKYILNDLHCALLNDLTTQSDEQFHAQLEQTSDVTYFADNFNVSDGDPTTNMMFYADSNQDKTLRVHLRLKMQIAILDSVSSVDYHLGLYKYENGVLYENPTNIHTFQTGTFGSSNPIEFDINEFVDVDLLENESLSIILFMDNSDPLFYYSLRSTTEIYNIVVENDSYYEPSYTKTILAHELGERLTKIIGADEFKSNLLGRTDIGYTSNGVASMTSLMHGHWVRRFETSPLYKKFTTSLKDYLESMNVLHGIGITIEKKGAKEVLRLESKDYFYQKFTSIKLGKVGNIKRYPAKEYFYSGIEVGYEKPNDSQLYEEAMGLDEYNTKTTLTTVINRIQNTLSLLSKYRGDSYGKEFARRKPISTHPTDDSRYDSDIFVSDVEWNGTNLRESKWSDDFDSLPTGVFSPETATNLMFSPMRILLKHGKYIKSGLTKYYNDFTRYSSSLGNSNLTTVKDGITLSENQNILNKDLGKAVYTAEWIEFKTDVPQSVKEQIKGYTSGVPNVYGLIEFENENGQLEKGYLFEYKQNDGEFKILKNGV
jgi:hypothetical protein